MVFGIAGGDGGWLVHFCQSGGVSIAAWAGEKGGLLIVRKPKRNSRRRFVPGYAVSITPPSCESRAGIGQLQSPFPNLLFLKH